MRVSYNPIATGNIIQHLAENMQSERAEGTHVSELISCLRKAWAKRNGYAIPIDQDTTLVFATGHALQDYIVGTADTEVRLELDGVHGTMDYFSDVDMLPTEVKATYYSSGEDITTKAPHYMAQIAAYCKMRGVLEGKLMVFYINGPYNLFRKAENKVLGQDGRPVRSVLKVYDVEFTQPELDAWWEELQYRKGILERAEDIEQIPIRLHHTWECDRCPLLGEICPGGEGAHEKIYEEVFA